MKTESFVDRVIDIDMNDIIKEKIFLSHSLPRLQRYRDFSTVLF